MPEMTYNDLPPKTKESLYQEVLFLTLANPKIKDAEQHTLNHLSNLHWPTKKRFKNWRYWNIISKVEKLQASFT